MHLLFASLCNWHITAEVGGWPPMSILHRISTEGVVVSSGRPGHKILCKEMTPDQTKAQMVFNKLSLGEKIIIVAKHYPESPKNFDDTLLYKKWTDREKADYLGLSMAVFSNKYKDILKKSSKMAKGG